MRIWKYAFVFSLILSAVLTNIGLGQTDITQADPKTAQIYKTLAGEVDSAALQSRIRTLSSIPSRVSGYPGCNQAADFVFSELQKAGVSDLHRDTYEVTVPIDEGSWLTIGGHKIRLHPLWPNLVRTSQLPPKGLNCPLIYVNKGELPAYNGKNVDGSAVLMDFNCGSEWLNAPRLGAKAVIFAEPPSTMRGEAEAKFMSVPISVPRFWVSKQDAEFLKTACATGEPKTHLTCKMTWRSEKTQNILGTIPGTDPKLKDQVIVLESYYDSMSVVPNLAPGADTACGVASMIELAKIFKNNPPKRTILLISTAGHFEGLRGISSYFDQHFSELEAPSTGESFRIWWAKHFQVLRVLLILLILILFKGLYDRFKNKKPVISIAGVVGIALIALLLMGHPGTVNRNGKKQIYLFSCLDLTSRTNSVGAFYKGMFLNYREDIQSNFGDISTMLWDNANKAATTLGFDVNSRYNDGITPRDGRVWQNYIPGKIGLDGEIATLAGGLGVSFVTTNDARELVDTPFDTANNVNIANLSDQVKLLACEYYNILNDPNVPKNPTDPKFPVTEPARFTRMGLQGGFGTVSGTVVEFDPRVSFIPKKPVLNSVVVVRNANKSFMGVRGNIVEVAKTQRPYIPGRKVRELQAGFRIPGMPVVTAYSGTRKPTELAAFKLDPNDGNIVYAPDQGISGAKSYPLKNDMSVGEVQMSVVLFPCVATSVYDLIDQQTLKALSTLNIYDAISNGEPRLYGYCMAMPEPFVSHVEDAAVIFSMPNTKMKIVMGSGPTANRLVLINSTKKDPEGIGINVGVGDISNTSMRVAEDLWNMDEFRINRLAKYRIVNEGINELHAKAKVEIQEARDAASKKDYSEADAHARSGWGLESRAYPDVQATAHDVVQGVLFYMALLLPFAYFLERLFFGYSDLKRQIVAAGALFIAVFTIFRYVHPAFDITINPLIILLAFIMLALSVIVIALIVGKFEEQLKSYNLQMGGVHKADIGRMNIAAAAFSLGISNMRRRKSRTVLTCITLILLTFTVLSFTSVVNVTKFNIIPSMGKPLYNGIMLRTATWEPLQEPAYRILQDEFRNRPVAPRAWFMGAQPGEQSFLRLSYQGHKYDAKAAVGLTPAESKVTHTDRALLAGRWFNDKDMYSILLPVESAVALNIKPEDVGKATIQYSGINFTVIGILRSRTGSKEYAEYKGRLDDLKKSLAGKKPNADDAAQLVTLTDYAAYFSAHQKGTDPGVKDLKDLDQEILTPVDSVAMSKQGGGNSGKSGGFKEYIHMEPDNCFFVPYSTLINMGGEVRSLAISFVSPKEVQTVLGKLMYRLTLNLYAGRGGKIFRYSSIGATSTSGMQTVAIPILIAALIVLNTMLGAVYERVREIGIFSSIGLAPNHIAMLFMAESLVYGVIGAVAGYLVGQGASKLITMFNLLPGLYLNFSSQSAVLSTGLVLVTVLLSTLYPARMASEVATPALERTWRVPEPVGDLWTIKLPFSVTGTQAAGLNGFLSEWLHAYEEYSIGDFVTKEVKGSMQDTEFGKAYQVQFMTWVAPFDLGVSQLTIIHTDPTEMEDVYDVSLEIRRVSGDVSNWKRVNRRFMNTVRKQFLIWRTLSPEDREQYTKQTILQLTKEAGA